MTEREIIFLGADGMATGILGERLRTFETPLVQTLRDYQVELGPREYED